MSFLSPSTGAAPSAAANGLGRILGGVDGSRIGDIAARIGTASNRFAEIGGAPAGYTGPARDMNTEMEARIAALRSRMPARGMNSTAEVENIMQTLHPSFLQQLIQQFRGQAQ